MNKLKYIIVLAFFVSCFGNKKTQQSNYKSQENEAVKVIDSIHTILEKPTTTTIVDKKDLVDRHEIDTLHQDLFNNELIGLSIKKKMLKIDMKNIG